MMTIKEVEAKAYAAFESVKHAIEGDPEATALRNDALQAVGEMRGDAINEAKDLIAEFAANTLAPIVGADGAKAIGQDAAAFIINSVEQALAAHYASVMPAPAAAPEPATDLTPPEPAQPESWTIPGNSTTLNGNVSSSTSDALTIPAPEGTETVKVAAPEGEDTLAAQGEQAVVGNVTLDAPGTMALGNTAGPPK